MDECDFLGEQVVRTASGSVILSVASHADGTVSVVAWLAHTGQRVGLLRRGPRGRAANEELLDRAWVSPSLMVTMQALLETTLLGQSMPMVETPPVGVTDTVTPTEMSDLLGWQWLLAELGEYHSVEELAAQAGLPRATSPRSTESAPTAPLAREPEALALA